MCVGVGLHGGVLSVPRSTIGHLGPELGEPIVSEPDARPGRVDSDLRRKTSDKQKSRRKVHCRTAMDRVLAEPVALANVEVLGIVIVAAEQVTVLGDLR